MGTTAASMTFETFERLPDDGSKHELLEGVLTTLPPPKADHSEIQRRIYDILRPYTLTGGLGEVMLEAGYRLGMRSWIQPDVSFMRPEQFRARGADGYFEGAPALVVEVVSDSNTPEEIDEKIRLSFAYGCEEVWVVYPKTRRVWVYGPGNSARLFETEPLKSPLFPGLAIPLDQIF